MTKTAKSNNGAVLGFEEKMLRLTKTLNDKLANSSMLKRDIRKNL